MDCSSAASYWPFCCFKLLGNFHLQGFFCIEARREFRIAFVLRKAIRGFRLRVVLLLQAIEGLRFRIIIYLKHAPSPHLAISVHHISIYLKYGPLMWRFRFIIHLKHVPSFGDSGSSYIVNVATSLDDCDSSYILNTPPRVVFPFIISVKHSPVTWRLGFIIYVQHAPPYGDSGSSYILNTPPPFIWRFRFIIYLKYGPIT